MSHKHLIFLSEKQGVFQGCYEYCEGYVMSKSLTRIFKASQGMDISAISGGKNCKA